MNRFKTVEKKIVSTLNILIRLWSQKNWNNVLLIYLYEIYSMKKKKNEKMIFFFVQFRFLVKQVNYWFYKWGVERNSGLCHQTINVSNIAFKISIQFMSKISLLNLIKVSEVIKFNGPFYTKCIR